MAQRIIGNPLNRENKNDLNDNFTELFDKINKSASDSEEALTKAEEALSKVGEGNGYLSANKGAEYPLRNEVFRGEKKSISDFAKGAILDVKVFGALIDRYYMLEMVSNGFEANGKERWGITLTEYYKDGFESSGTRSRYIFRYNNDDMSGNEGNANYVKGSDGIDTITVDNGEIACSVTVDRDLISNTGNGLFINLFSTHAPTAIIDPSNYFF